MDVNLTGSAPAAGTLDEAVAVYLAAFGQPSYEEGQLIAGRPAPAAVHSVHPQAGPARGLYQGRGWTTLTEEFRIGPDQPAYGVMARPL